MKVKRLSFFEKYYRVMGLLLLMMLCSKYAFSQTQRPSSEDLKWLNTHTYKVDDLALNTKNFEQLEHLKSAIGNRKVVLLGEQTHGDGTTFEAKALLVKFLHEEMGFNSLVFENGMYQSYKSWNELSKGKSYQNVMSLGMHKRWANVKQIQPVFSYIEQSLKTNSPLMLAGMDIQFDGAYCKQSLVLDFENFLSKNYPQLIKRHNYSVFKTLIASTIQNLNQLPSKSNQELILENLKYYSNQLIKENKEGNEWNTNSFWIQVWENLSVYLKNNWERLDGSYVRSTYFNNRSLMMAKNLKWIIENDEKVIVWAATNHTLKNVDPAILTQMGWSSKTKFMGEYLSGFIGSHHMFNIAFSGYNGEYLEIYSNTVKRFKKPSQFSIEALLNDVDLDFGYLILNAKNTPRFFRDPCLASFIFNKEYSASWRPSIDAVFFTKTMKASKTYEKKVTK